jgi:electron transfer flavoprotein alpha/beta subunit
VNAPVRIAKLSHKRQQEKLEMKYPEIVWVDLELPDPAAPALAQLVKRIAWEAIQECSANEDECYRIRSAVEKLRRSLVDAGYAPR